MPYQANRLCRKDKHFCLGKPASWKGATIRTCIEIKGLIHYSTISILKEQADCFICRWTCFIRWADEASPPADEASPPADEVSPQADEASSPANEASPIGPFIFVLFLSFLKCFLYVCSKSFTIRISVKNCFFLRTYVDLLNYPFKWSVECRIYGHWILWWG